MSAEEGPWTSAEPWVYGAEPGGLVFVPERIGRSRLNDFESVMTAGTYGDARQLKLVTLWLPGVEEGDEQDDADPYDPNQFDDWPPRLATYALDHWPDDLGDIGEERDSFPSAPRLFIDEDDEDQVVTALRDRGYRVRRDDDLFARTQRHL